MFGFSKTEIIGVSIERLIHEDCASLQGISVESYLEQNASELMRKIHKIPGRRRDGARFDLELSMSVAESDGHLFYTAILREREQL
jgi:PAS domain S-box-containing protein